ncbi:MAG TPA: hypothetical protein VHF50_00050 [Solirubrobacterales bacterium]|nr:hypothetical protein [Solirubrobacterales bacterium]
MTEFRALVLVFVVFGIVGFAGFSALISIDANEGVMGLALITLIAGGSFASSSVVMHYGDKRREAEDQSHKPPAAG